MSEPWFRIGHQTNESARTGCTAIIFDRQVPAIADVRGGGPGTRETTLLDPGRRGIVDAISLSGGSAFGLSTVDGVMRYLVEQSRGLSTPAGPVPLVPSAIIYDLAEGEAVIPTGDDGYKASTAAQYGEFSTGAIGAGTGATVAKIAGTRTKGGVGVATMSVAGIEVCAIIVLNSVGCIMDPASGKTLAGPADYTIDKLIADHLAYRGPDLSPGENTTLGAVMISAPLSRSALVRCGVAAHNGLARCILPAHTLADGDTIFCVAQSPGEVDDSLLMQISVGVQATVERAITGLYPSSARTGS